jgi:hypothetical protein
MADVLPQTGSSDLQGSTSFRSGTVGTTWVNLPASDDKEIGEILIAALTDQTKSNRLLVNLDGGSEFKTLLPGEILVFQPRGGIKHIQIKGNVASVSWEAVINYEP